MSMTTLLRRSIPGKSTSIQNHIKRGERIADAINERYGVSEPRQYKAKHLRWFLSVHCSKLSDSTKYDYWRTVRALCSALGKWPDWEPHLRGEWVRSGKGGRPAKLAHKSKKLING